jgi:hypothetical protein
MCPGEISPRSTTISDKQRRQVESYTKRSTEKIVEKQPIAD